MHCCRSDLSARDDNVIVVATVDDRTTIVEQPGMRSSELVGFTWSSWCGGIVGHSQRARDVAMNYVMKSTRTPLASTVSVHSAQAIV